jgi:GT2 family glycosyltransferase
MTDFEKNKTPFFSVVVPSYERPDDLGRCLHALSQENQSKAPPHEIIVTDDSRTDHCRVLVEQNFPEVSWGKGKHNGPAGNRNAGVARAKGEWIVFIDDDCVARPGYLANYASAIASHSEIVVFEGHIFPDRPRRTWAEGCPVNTDGGMFWTSNLCVKRKVFDELCGFDERFEVAYEDVDFAYRLKESKAKTLFVKTAAACHPWRTLRQEGNNWKPKGFELKELLHFLQKHPNAREHSSPLVYVRHLLRMLTKDLATCTFNFQGKGIDVWFSQVTVTIIVIIILIKKKLN